VPSQIAQTHTDLAAVVPLCLAIAGIRGMLNLAVAR